MSLKLTFHGAAGCVTGFCARVETEHAVVLVDCGMFQGSKTLKALNYAEFPFRVDDIDAVLLTHAHIDHSGLLPKLVRAGYKGPIFATAGTRDLCAVMLRDSAEIQDSEVRQLNRRNQRRGRPEVEPIYTTYDVGRCIDAFCKVKLNAPEEVAKGIVATYWEAGHILGSASIALEAQTEEGPVTLLFSGDLGPGGRDYAADPEGPSGVDHLIMESTYGDRDRALLDSAGRRALLAQELREAEAAGGPLLIPAFAVERSQELLADIMLLMDQGEISEGPVFLDSPLAIEAAEVFRERGWNRNSQRNPFADLTRGGRLRMLRSPAESDHLEFLSGWHIIMAASGMCDAGRVRRHLKRLLWRRQATVLLTGYQAVGTLGRYLQEGARRVSIQGEEVQVRARIRMLDAYSAHADAEGLVAWARVRAPVRGGIFLVHGEPAACAGLAKRLEASGLAAANIITPGLDETYLLGPATVSGPQAAQRRLAQREVAHADWHNARAGLLMALNDQLEVARDDREREQIIARLTAALEDAEQSAQRAKAVAVSEAAA